jgi:thioredoxin-dependent peroxiredoxin
VGLLEFAVLLAWATILLLLWAGFQLVAQNGRVLLRLEALERQLGDLVGLGFVQQSAAVAAVEGVDHEHELQEVDEVGWTAGIPAGTVLHDFELPDLDGQQHLRSAWLGKRIVMLFVSPYCRHSRALLVDLARLPTNQSSRPELLIVSTGSIDENRRLIERSGFSNQVLLQEEMEVGALFEVTATPMAYLVDEDGRTASPLAAGRAAIVGLILSSTANGGTPAILDSPSPELIEAATTPAPVNGAQYQGGLEPGNLAPSFALPGLDGGTVALDQFRGDRIMIVFTDLMGPPCDAVLQKLEELNRASGGPQVVLVVRGDVDANRTWAQQHEVSLPVGVQTRWDISREYGLLAAPIAFLVSEQGTIAAPVAVGVDSILDLCHDAAESG